VGKALIAQVFSNLIGNTMQYGFKDAPIDVTLLENNIIKRIIHLYFGGVLSGTRNSLSNDIISNTVNTTLNY